MFEIVFVNVLLVAVHDEVYGGAFELQLGKCDLPAAGVGVEDNDAFALVREFLELVTLRDLYLKAVGPEDSECCAVDEGFCERCYPFVFVDEAGEGIFCVGESSR